LALGPLAGCNLSILPTNLDGQGSTDTGNGNEPGTGNSFEPNADTLPDFSLTDVNANSSRYQKAVSPRDYLGQVTAWYFGHAT